MEPGPVAGGGRERSLTELRRYEALRLGSMRAFRELLAEHGDAMARVAGWCTDDPEEVRRLVRVTWSTVLAGLNMFTWHSTFRAWLFSILVAHGRTRAGAVTAVDPPDRILAVPQGEAPRLPASLADLPWTQWWAEGSWSALAAALAARGQRGREVALLVDHEGWSSREACDALGLTAGALQRLLDGYREALAARLLADLGVVDHEAADHEAAGRATTDGATTEGADTDEASAEHQGVAGLVSAMPRPLAPPPDRELLALFRRWRTDRGLTPLRRLLARRPRTR